MDAIAHLMTSLSAADDAPLYARARWSLPRAVPRRPHIRTRTASPAVRRLPQRLPPAHARRSIFFQAACVRARIFQPRPHLLSPRLERVSSANAPWVSCPRSSLGALRANSELATPSSRARRDESRHSRLRWLRFLSAWMPMQLLARRWLRMRARQTRELCLHACLRSCLRVQRLRRRLCHRRRQRIPALQPLMPCSTTVRQRQACAVARARRRLHCLPSVKMLAPLSTHSLRR